MVIFNSYVSHYQRVWLFYELLMLMFIFADEMHLEAKIAS